MKKIYIAVVLLVAVVFTGFVASIFTGGVDAETRSGSSQFVYSRHIVSLSNVTLNSSSVGFSDNDLTAEYIYKEHGFLAPNYVKIFMQRIGGKTNYWADGSIAYFNTSNNYYKGAVQHEDYPSGGNNTSNINVSSSSSKIGETFYRATAYPTTQDYSDINNQNTYFWQIDICPADYDTGH